jgi:methylated-DNA-[protein]-cysteine S-methyltransferase
MKTFTQKVLDIVRSIPKGSVLSYKQVAEKAGSPKAFRAVGSLMKKNYDTEIPCHRVISSSGRVGDYNRGGEEVKKKILRDEGYEQK